MMSPAEMIAALERLNVPRAKAEAVVQANNGAGVVSEPAPATVRPANGQIIAEPGSDRPVSEMEEQRRIRRTVIERGGRVWWLSQARKTGQSPGIPDLWMTIGALGIWWEVKARDGKLSAFQEDFRDACLQTLTLWGSGTHADFLAFLDDLEISA